MTAFNEEPQTLLIVVAGVLFGFFVLRLGALFCRLGALFYRLWARFGGFGWALGGTFGVFAGSRGTPNFQNFVCWHP